MSSALLQSLLPALALLLIFAGTIQLMYRTKSIVNYLLLGMYLSLAYYLFYLWMFGSGVLPKLLFSTEISIALLVAPFISIYFLILSGVLKKTTKILIPPVLLAIVSYLSIIIFNATSEFALPVSDSFHPYFELTGIRYIINLCIDLYFLICAAALVSAMLVFGIPLKKRNRFTIIIFVFSLLYFSGTLCIVLTYIVKSDILVFTSTAVYCLLALSFLYFSYRYPRETQFILTEVIIKNKKVGKIPAWAPTAEKKLRSFFEDEYLYRDPNISVTSVSKKIGISENQLSWLVNNRFDMNFRSFVNVCRVSEAKKLLVENHSMNILEIAFFTGFNSKSSFNTVFKEQSGLTPGEFKKQHQNS